VTKAGVICSPALGDTLLFSAVLQDLRLWFDRRTGAETEIVHFCMKQNLAAAEIIPGADRRVLVDLTNPVESIRKIRAERLDVLLDFSSWQRLTAFYSMVAGAKFVAGFRTPKQYRGRGYDITAPHQRDFHELENFRELLRVLKIPAESVPRVVVSATAVAPLAGEKDIVVFHLWPSGAQSWLREWPEERWIALAKRLAESETLFVITGAASDLGRSELFVERMQRAGLRSTVFIGPDGFNSLTLLLRRARVVVSVNTSVMHLSAIVGTPTVSLNGPTADHRWGPVGPCGTGVGPEDGSGGYLHLGFEFGGQDETVMERISVEQVVEAARKTIMLRGRRGQEARSGSDAGSDKERTGSLSAGVAG
jgi:heptosyltransferase III